MSYNFEIDNLPFKKRLENLQKVQKLNKINGKDYVALYVELNKYQSELKNVELCKQKFIIPIHMTLGRFQNFLVQQKYLVYDCPALGLYFMVFRNGNGTLPKQDTTMGELSNSYANSDDKMLRMLISVESTFGSLTTY